MDVLVMADGDVFPMRYLQCDDDAICERVRAMIRH